MFRKATEPEVAERRDEIKLVESYCPPHHRLRIDAPLQAALAETGVTSGSKWAWC